MTESEAQSIAHPIAATSRVESVGSFPMSKEGRRQAIILLLGVGSIWVFALWSLITILENGLTGVEWISSLLMLGMLVVSPMVAWALLEEANSRITTGERGITYATFGGITLTYGWDEVSGFKPKGRKSRIARFFLGEDDDTEENSNKLVRSDRADDIDRDDSDAEPDTLLLAVRKDRTVTIANPVVRFLHKQSHGDSLPIYGGLENRDELLAEIASRLETS